MDAFFKGLQIPEDKIYQYVADKLKYQELSPEQRNEQDRVTQTQRRAIELEQQNNVLQQQYQQAEIRNREIQLNNALSNADVQNMARSYDQRRGVPGSFKDEIIMRGVALYQKTGKDYSPEEVIQDMMGLIGSPTASSSVPNNSQPGMAMSTAVSSVPVIPNVGGKNSAPIKKNIKSLDEMRKLANSL